MVTSHNRTFKRQERLYTYGSVEDLGLNSIRAKNPIPSQVVLTRERDGPQVPSHRYTTLLPTAPQAKKSSTLKVLYIICMKLKSYTIYLNPSHSSRSSQKLRVMLENPLYLNHP